MVTRMFQLRPLPRTLQATLRDLGDAKASVRKSALRDVARLASGDDRSEAVAALIDLLGDPNPEMRADAALALADAEARSALDALLEATLDAHAAVRQMALLAIGELAPRGHKAACSAVVSALAADVGALRFQALHAAHKLDIPDLARWLLPGLKDPDPKVRYLALRLLDERGGRSDHALKDHGQDIYEACESALSDAQLEVRVVAAFLFAREGDPRAGRALVEGLNSGVQLEAPEDMQELVELCGELELADAEPGLKRHAWGRFGLVPGRFAWQAKVSLARLGNERARREILRGLSSWDSDTRTLSVVAAGRARLAQAKERLESLGRDPRMDPALVRDALREIG